ncbi:response regulator transcription factor, partial [bacterium]
PAVVACAGPGARPDLPAAALAAGALDLFSEQDSDEVLGSRLRAHLKRLFPRAVPPGTSAAGPVRLDLRAREARVRRGDAWRPVPGLTAREFDLLAALAQAAGRPLSREELLGALGLDASPEAVDKAVGALRRKLGPAGRGLKTVRGYGYRLG